jgi:hypothetical protein
MKNLRTPLLFACLLFAGICSAQSSNDFINEPTDKPKLFAGLPETVTLNINTLTDLLQAPIGQQVRITLSGNQPFAFEGLVISSANKYENSIQSVVIRSTNFNGAILSFSKIIIDEKKINYTGRIVSMQHGDVYILKTENNQFMFVKKNIQELVME